MLTLTSGAKGFPSLPTVDLPLLDKIPFLGAVLNGHSLFVYLTWLFVLVLWVFIYKTPYGFWLAEHQRREVGLGGVRRAEDDAGEGDVAAGVGHILGKGAVEVAEREVRACERGETVLTCVSGDGFVTKEIPVTVSYTAGQWLIKILLFGWIWH